MGICNSVQMEEGQGGISQKIYKLPETHCLTLQAEEGAANVNFLGVNFELTKIPLPPLGLMCGPSDNPGSTTHTLRTNYFKLTGSS